MHSPFLLPVGSGAEKAGDTGGLRGELGAVTRDDSDAEDDWLTPKVMSESLSSWEPLKDPDGVMVSELDCRVPGSQTGVTLLGCEREAQALVMDEVTVRGSVDVCALPPT